MLWVFLVSFFSVATTALTQLAHLNFKGNEIGSLVDLNVLEDKHGANLFLLSYLDQVHPEDGAPSYTTWRHSITRNGLVWTDFKMKAVPEDSEVKQGSLFQYGPHQFISVYSSRPKPERVKPTPKLAPGQKPEPTAPEIPFQIGLSKLKDFNSVEHYPESLIKDTNNGNASPVLIPVEVSYGDPVLVLVTISKKAPFCHLDLHAVITIGKPKTHGDPTTLRLYHEICTSLSIFRHPFEKNTFQLSYTGYDKALDAFVTTMEKITVQVNMKDEAPVQASKLIRRTHVDGVPNAADYVFREYKNKVYAMARTITAIKELPLPNIKLNSVSQLRVLDLTSTAIIKQLPLAGNLYRGPAATIKDRTLEVKGQPGAEIACIAMDNVINPNELNPKNPIAFVVTINLSSRDDEADSRNNPKFEIKLSASRGQDVRIGYKGFVGGPNEDRAVAFYVITNTHDRPVQEAQNQMGSSTVAVAYSGRPVKLEIYVDTNIIEVYGDDGQYVLTAYYYFADPDDRFEQACMYQLEKNYWISVKNASVQKFFVQQFPKMDDTATKEFIHKAENNLNLNGGKPTNGTNPNNGTNDETPPNHSSRLLLHPISICLLIGFFFILNN